MGWTRKSIGSYCKYSIIILVALLGSLSPASAGSFLNTIYSSVEYNDKVAAAKADADATRERIRVSQGAWFPELDLKLKKGREFLNKPLQPKTRLDYSGVNVEVTQLLWDFGVSNTLIEKARLKLLRSELQLFQTRQNVMFETVSAAIQMKRAKGVLRYARKSENNVRYQSGLEEARARAGDGLSTDVLQAKTQLAGAQARRIQSQGSEGQAHNRYRRFFRSEPVSLRALKILNSVEKELPRNIYEALKIAKEKSPLIRIAAIDEIIANKNVQEIRSDKFLPRLELIGKSKINRNVGGTLGTERGSSIEVQLSFPFNLGFTSVNILRAGQSELAAASSRVAVARRDVEEQVRNAWQKYETARFTAILLRDQATLAEAFLKLARKERTLGNRSLIDVLAGESAHFNALSDTLAMDADVLIAAFEILKTTGQLIAPDELTVRRKIKKSSKQKRWSR